MFKSLKKINTSIVLMLTSMTVLAATSTNIEVSAIIEKGCLFQESPDGLNFGTHASTSQENAITASIVNSQDTWKVECTPDVPVTITFGNGKSLNVSTQNRRLKHVNSENYIDYVLYRNVNLTQQLGTTSANNTLTLKSTEQNHLLNFQIYGLIDLSQGAINKMPGQYKDDVLITIAW
ncbi:Csu type fimbrial protein [Acinetobacter gerneri]|jgi:spore coat protein U-like protein|uniref:Csu type fimbrial protein n=1 Tax=Acinetobacter gerneri TaxID=202952 RepID=UPI0023F495D9|nr:spore coat protein U domain-containing protein [Acinetobacter gerneri]MCH4246096.1 spore coat U domain-containing protein [Acinetobacter gerneri]